MATSLPTRVAFASPEQGLNSYINLSHASEMTGGAHRMKDLANIVGLIKARSLPADLADQLDPFVRNRYLEIWQELQVPDPEELA